MGELTSRLGQLPFAAGEVIYAAEVATLATGAVTLAARVSAPVSSQMSVPLSKPDVFWLDHLLNPSAKLSRVAVYDIAAIFA